MTDNWTPNDPDFQRTWFDLAHPEPKRRKPWRCRLGWHRWKPRYRVSWFYMWIASLNDRPASKPYGNPHGHICALCRKRRPS